jgi:hypothetical protein
LLDRSEVIPMPPIELTRPRLAFIVMTRAVLAAGVGLLVSQKLTKRTTRILGATLGAIGAVTTIPALGFVMKAAKRGAREERIGSERLQTEADDPFSRRLVQLHT